MGEKMTFNAVSYTHLDVYKRQELERRKDKCRFLFI